ncbi:MAG: cytochrome P450 [Myxococcota bacterium]|jgi:cytochrome P450
MRGRVGIMSVAVTPPESAYPPGPPARRGLFETLKYWRDFARDPVAFVGNRFVTYGDIYHAQNDDNHLYVLKHPEHVHEVLVTQAAAFTKQRDDLEQVLGKGLFMAEGDLWRKQRRLIQPAFHRSAIASYAQVIDQYTSELVDTWTDGETRDISDDMMALTLRIVCKCLFDHDVRSQTDRVGRAMDALHRAAVSPSLLPGWVPSPARARLKRARQGLWEIIDGMVANRRAAGDAHERTDLLSMLLVAGEDGGMSDQQLRDELVTMFLAGHETTSHGLTWAFYLLSQNPGERDRLEREAAQPEPGEWVGAMVRESLRLYPPAYVFGRVAVEDVSVGGYDISAGSEVLVWLYHTHHDARWFPDPEAFKPERFLAGAEPPIDKRAWLPFGAGQRLCIGKSFAELEMQRVLVGVAKRARLDLVQGHRVAMQPRITLTPKHGMRMTVSII